ncbi:substrate-binding domain-containing protein [Acidisoma cellulosilytica]|uniref:Substrate-binding domain-containing protein n=1 Tax=Acidisoma cellulosilyticum TaxID=2802395 RepID=A0A963YX04_9PROT|nr:substrate-binding domain-containing protein [Acidisoma cellulosilyticum]MCB8878752.1 substrate-binding domain-containing protein [Acidisoma cellulosilyticum]
MTKIINPFVSRRQAGGLVLGGLIAAAGMPRRGFADTEKVMATVVKIQGVPWFNFMQKGLIEGGETFHINSTMVGPVTVDPAQQVRLVEDQIAKKVDVLGLVPLDVKVLAPVLARAQAAGIIVITQEGPNQDGRTWDVELLDSVAFGQMQMKALAQDMGETGEYVIYVGTLTTPLHNKWADAAIAYQLKNYPNMKLATSRFPGADEIDTSEQVTREVLQGYPNVRGILGFGSNGPIGSGNIVRQRHLQKKISIVGTVIPSQAKPLIEAGVIRQGFLWSPKDAGYAMVAVASLQLQGAKFETGMEIPGMGKATVDAANKLISVDRILTFDKANIDSTIAATGL